MGHNKNSKSILDFFSKGFDKLSNWIKNREKAIDKKEFINKFESFDVEFSRNDKGIPVVNTTHNKNGVIEKFYVEYVEKSLSEKEDLHEKILKAKYKYPAEIMGVLHEADLEITKIDVSLESVMPEIIAPMTTALKDNLGHYGFNEDATINVIGEDEDIKLGSRMMLENNGIKQWDFSGHIIKNGGKFNISLDGKGNILEKNISNDSATIEKNVKYIMLYSRNLKRTYYNNASEEFMEKEYKKEEFSKKNPEKLEKESDTTNTPSNERIENFENSFATYGDVEEEEWYSF